MNNQYFNNVENNEKKFGKGKSILIMVFLSLIISGCILAGLYYTNIITFKTETTCPKEEKSQDNCDKKEKLKDLYFKNGNIIGDEQIKYNYELMQSIYGISTKDFYGYQSGVKLSIMNIDTIKTTFQLDNNQNVKDEYNLSFSKNVVDILAGYATNGIGSSGVFFFLMEDGTVEYLPLYKAFSDDNIKSYGPIKGVEGVIKLYEAAKEPKEGDFGGNYAILAQNKDGKIYDLSKILIDEEIVY